MTPLRQLMVYSKDDQLAECGHLHTEYHAVLAFPAVRKSNANPKPSTTASRLPRLLIGLSIVITPLGQEVCLFVMEKLLLHCRMCSCSGGEIQPCMPSLAFFLKINLPN